MSSNFGLLGEHATRWSAENAILGSRLEARVIRISRVRVHFARLWLKLETNRSRAYQEARKDWR